jgi:hypothetical protein
MRRGKKCSKGYEVRATVLAALCCIVLVACEKSETQILQERLDDFRNLLPLELKQEFDSKNYPEVVAGIDSLLQTEPSFKTRFGDLKHKELIDVFSTQDVVDYYKEYFVEKLEKLKRK